MEQPTGKTLTIALTLISFILFSCVEDTITVEDMRGNGYNPTTENSVSDITFSALVNERQTRVGTTPLQQNRYVAVYAILSNTKEYYTTTNYYTYEPGFLTPIDNAIMKVPNDLYDFVALSLSNVPSYPPKLLNSVASDLYNGVDYLMFELTSQNIRSSTNIPILFNHLCSQMLMLIDGDTEIKVDSLANATITPPSPTGLVIAPFSGGIAPAVALADTTMAMVVTDSVCQQILLPLNYSDSLTFKFSAWINNNTAPIDYTAKVGLIDDKLRPGYSYVFQFLIKNDNTLEYLVTVNDWVEVDEEGSPLYPVLR